MGPSDKAKELARLLLDMHPKMGVTLYDLAYSIDRACHVIAVRSTPAGIAIPTDDGA